MRMDAAAFDAALADDPDRLLAQLRGPIQPPTANLGAP
jgi:hypothetical protein